MAFSLTDIILLIIVLGFAIGGLFAGFIRTLGAIVAFFVGAFVASRYFISFGDWLSPIIGNHPVAAKIIAFLVLFILVDRIVVLVFYLLGKIFGLITFIPFLKTINRLTGFVLGLVEGVLVVGLVIYIIAKVASGLPFIYDNLAGSQVANFLVAVVTYISSWALPEAIIQMQTIF